MTQVMPSFWPAVDQEGLKLAPLKRGQSWLAVLKVDPQTRLLTPREEETVLRLGFQKGRNGRYILPGVPTAAGMQSLATLFGGEVAPLDPGQAHYLESAEQLEPPIPDALRQGVAWWWGHNRQRMMGEIRHSLKRSDDAWADSLLGKMTPNQWRNPDQLRVWMSQAFAGEVTPVTEPILGMGLAKAAQMFDGEMPDDLERWRLMLAEYRGDPEPDSAELRPMARMLDNELADSRPAIGTSVEWSDSSGAHRGRVVKHSSEEADAMWVASDRPRFISGMPLPAQQKVSLDQIASRPMAQLGPESTAQTTQPGAEARRWTISIDDLPNADIKAYGDTGRLNAEARELLRAGIHVGAIPGRSPLLMDEGDAADRMITQWGAVRSHLGETLGGEETPETREAKAIIRDEQIAEFNKLQPEVVTGATRPTLAVLPVAASGLEKKESYRNPEARSNLMKEMAYAVGIHPLAREELRTAFLEQVRSSDPHTDKPALDKEAIKISSALKTQTVTLGRLGVCLSPDLTTKRVNDLFESASQEGDPNEAMLQLSQGRLSTNPEAMQRNLVAALSDKGMLPENLLKANNSAMNSIANLAGKSRHSLENLNHPLFIFMDILEARGVMNGWSRPEQLTALGINLREDYETAGAMASLAGARLTQVQEETIKEFVEPYGDGLRGIAASGMVANDDGARAFTLGAVSTGEDLAPVTGELYFLKYEDRYSGQDHIESLGKLASLGAVQPIRFSDTLTDGVVTQKVLNELDPTWYGASDILRVRALGRDGRRRGNEASFAALDPTGIAVPQFPRQEGGGSSRAMVEAAGNSAKGLQVLTETWRNDMTKEDKVRQAIRMWAAEHKHIREMTESSQNNIAENILETLVQTSDAEMVLVSSKRTRGRMNYKRLAVTAKDVRDAGFDRTAAAEMKSMVLSGVRYDRGRRIEAFDAMSALKPEALRYLNEVKAEEEKKRQQEAKEATPSGATPDKRGARQNRGLVAGLSIKDMRGSAETVISNLTSASAEDQKKMAQKTRLWEAPDWVSLRKPEDDNEQAMDPLVAQFWSGLRKDLPSKSPANIEAINSLYAESILGVRDLFSEIRTVEQLDEAIDEGGALTNHFEAMQLKAEEAGLQRHRIIGDLLGFGVFYGLKTFRREGQRISQDNTEWPAALGRTRRAAAANKDQYGAMPALNKLVRNGEDFRKGIDTDEETLLRTFGFSGIEYGESMPQRERTEYLNHAYDGFMDLSRFLDVDPQALSLGGSLGLTFGSRGRGGRRAALAHYEPQNNVINLTRLKGAGSMAHEYGHAMANYFHRMTSGQVRGGGDLTYSIGSQPQIKEMTQETVGSLRKPVHDAFALIMATIKYEPIKQVDADEALSLAAFEQNARNRSHLNRDATWADNDSRSSKTDPYWSSPHELFARSFETWVNHRLRNTMDSDYQNDFLVRGDKLEAWGTPMAEQETPATGKKRPQLYPSGEQLKHLDKAFDRLIKEVRTGTKPVTHEHLGKIDLPYMYSYDTGSIEKLSPQEMGAVAQSVISDVARMCGEGVEVQWERELRDDAGSLVAGRFSVIEGPEDQPSRGVRGLMELAYGAPSSTAYHEAFHYAQEVLLTPEERQVLDHEFTPGQPLHGRLVDTLADQGKHELAEACQDTREAQAYAYQEWVRGSLEIKVEEQPRTFFGQVKDFCKKIFSVGNDSGFKEPQSIFSAFYDGRLAARENLEASITQAREQAEREQQSAQQAALWSTEPVVEEAQARRAPEEVSDESLLSPKDEDGRMYGPA
jgi:hypothetical protein